MVYQKGHIPWSKVGLKGKHASPETEFKPGHKMSDETIEKIRVSQTGRSIPWADKIRKTLMGHPVSKETRKKISDNMKGRLSGDKNPAKRPEVREKIRLSKLGNKNAMFGKMSGKDNPNWHNGKSFEEYGVEFTKELKAKIRSRDGNRCRLCGKYENGRCHDVHHIDYNKKNNCEDNLITLCPPCHHRTGGRRSYWTAHFHDGTDFRLWT